MKVHGPSGLNPVRRSSLVNNAPRSSSSSKSSGETVAVSSMAAEMAAAKSTPEVIDETRIARLKEAIENGSFPIDPEKIARRMLGEET